MLPPGGATATTEAGQGQALLPDTFTLKRMSELFMERSEQNVIQLNQQVLTPGQVTNFIINNVGLGQDLELWVEGQINLVNTKVGTEVLTLAPEFPFDLISNLNVQFNGQTVIANLSAFELLGIMAKRHKNLLLGSAASGGAKFAQKLARVDKTLAYVEAGANVTLATGDTITGVTTATVAGSSTGVLKFGFFLSLPFTLRKDLLLGLIPMQNNSVYCNVALTSPALTGITEESPLHVDTTWPATMTANTAINVYPHYNFWSIPTPNDPKIYSYLVSHSYMLLSQANNPLTKTGAEALTYNMPNNYYLLALLLTLRDSAGALADVYSMLDNPYLNYNGTARVDRRKMAPRMARQLLQAEGIPSPPGQIIWDGTDVEYLPNGTNTSKWLNMYLANNPQFVADIAAGFSVSGKFSVLREQLVPANVQIV
jgi:hypothetical protein